MWGGNSLRNRQGEAWGMSGVRRCAERRMIMRRPMLPTIALSLMLAAPSSAAEKVTKYDRFDLWNGCRPVRLVVESLEKAATTIGLSRDAIQTAVRSRLRAARMYSDAAFSRLYVNVTVTRSAYGILITYDKEVFDHVSKLDDLASTWKAGSIGTHGRASDYILSDIAQHTDKFIDEYLRVNGDSCKTQPPAR